MDEDVAFEGEDGGQFFAAAVGVRHDHYLEFAGLRKDCLVGRWTKLH